MQTIYTVVFKSKTETQIWCFIMWYDIFFLFLSLRLPYTKYTLILYKNKICYFYCTQWAFVKNNTSSYKYEEQSCYTYLSCCFHSYSLKYEPLLHPFFFSISISLTDYNLIFEQLCGYIYNYIFNQIDVRESGHSVRFMKSN